MLCDLHLIAAPPGLPFFAFLCVLLSAMSTFLPPFFRHGKPETVAVGFDTPPSAAAPRHGGGEGGTASQHGKLIPPTETIPIKNKIQTLLKIVICRQSKWLETRPLEKVFYMLYSNVNLERRGGTPVRKNPFFIMDLSQCIWVLFVYRI